MTAEIALINRSALALAADSAATLRIGSKSKTYNTAEKIFEFSCRQPIAIMIYNNVEHVGVPLDVIIRKHRTECSVKFDSLKDAADEFLNYLLEFPRSPSQEGIYLAAIMLDIYHDLYQTLNRIVRKAINAKADGKPTSTAMREFDNAIDEAIKKFQDRPLKGFLEDKNLDEFINEYSEACDQAVNTAFKGLELIERHRNKLLSLAFAVVKSEIGSDLLTGLVFGGFGARDLFPTLHYLEIDGTYFGVQKILKRNEVDIDREGDRAAMVPFAQSDMAERFISGIDGELIGAIEDFIAKAVDEIATTKPDVFSKKEIKDIKITVLNEFGRTIEELMGTERRDLLDILNFMSKKEMGELAHALVELTSAKRRFSTDLETVGGPIDVAIVSRSEGFIWIKRKHYFESEANPGYFTRVFPVRAAGGADENQAGKSANSEYKNPDREGR
ncbi:hypothetical protein [Methylobacterium oryzihabitans]|uniref:Uncharacterized protein n=1 Tax=Methylobacterium oryzihabitans TaxID=2499852 RepID=A0A437P6E6_9HYPH|nr:hypothetical protein [Methylobacterium oryzihabitans]RVU17834.1 hypothetical protein EOE48_13230 [Methylobacterium oryzihabitans]